VKIQYVAMCNCVRETATSEQSEGGQQFWGSLFGEEWVQTVSII